jgi:phosphate:Na+ symporter
MSLATVASLLLGLGLFFAGLQWSGENLRKLAADRLGTHAGSTPPSRLRGALLGLSFGALMQSATAVTFSAINLVTSAVMTPVDALPVIVWANVGLTVLAFLATLNIHPWVTLTVGVSGILSGLLRVPGWRAGAAALFGVALMLFGLEAMGAAAAPLRTLAWFHALTVATAQAPLLAFAAGMLIAVVLQSNTGAALLIITLASSGTLDAAQSTMMIYGTNLGAIPLRALLSAGMRGTAVRLVRLEDTFCVMSGILMSLLFYLETWTGWPLVRAAARAVSNDARMQLATVFLISNALPALLITPLLRQCWQVLQRLWPQTAAEHASQPKYINDSSLADPATALDLAGLELARLASHVRVPLHDPAAQSYADAAFGTLAGELDRFLTRIPADTRSADALSRLPILREGLASVRYIEQSVKELQATAAKLAPYAPAQTAGAKLVAVIDQLLDEVGRALHAHEATQIEQLRSASRAHAPGLSEARNACTLALQDAPPDIRLVGQTLIDDADRIAWMVHRMSKLLTQSTPPNAANA